MTRAYTYRHRVTFDETNLVGNVYFTNYLHWQGHCREHFLADHAPGVLDALRSGELALVTVSCGMNFYTECFAFDVIEVAMRLGARGGNRITMDFDFARDGTVIATGTQTVACMRRRDGGMEPVHPPDDLRAALAEYA
ncbi:acyl-CoA thioesterase [Actinokineospora globicatena]|uniref:4-hydroxybenzoyl-CoA thioesterase n=1 Tax=Actinokineospora globicatena TaxID=103729 RepID=A0A9W6V5X0_9PSEU|nr:acyl-CoA thioesterase [Actinokineospora globicatena]MCP2303627.1 enediyne biosynthesis thioesterase [Actinokineospora globicatena]GLW79236.1 4-hydroxybenzoyl-CoA thioesterase [Actinokineospora globicatena]GLW86354.1 4-hydroxybenzoyl-CoA thioesterase [Actinokineospora globicatena]GLW89822.1 4-hydroxybenzoyl-CoA thioesterase [Actinokineospora globicatena]